jgi:hypothetical protein
MVMFGVKYRNKSFYVFGVLIFIGFNQFDSLFYCQKCVVERLGISFGSENCVSVKVQVVDYAP